MADGPTVAPAADEPDGSAPTVPPAAGAESVAARAARRADRLLGLHRQLGHGAELPPPPSPGDLWTAVRGSPTMLGPLAPVLWLIALVSVLACLLVWLAQGAGDFWLPWVVFGFGCAFGVDAAVARGLATGRSRAARAFGLHLWLSAYVAALLLAIWLLGGAGGFWPGWSLFGIGLALLVHALLTPVDPFGGGDEQLVARVDELTRTRSSVLDAQAMELRRIERDLHDGAQARLVALSMQLGRAEARLAGHGDPEILALVRGAQEEARAAIAELRDLARGIAPPLLVDRGLVAAIEALAQRSALAVAVEATGLERRLPTVVETAAYFVAAEALTNAAKHAGAETSVRVTLVFDGPWLRLTVADDGPGGADPRGSGLVGLRGRVEALDGRLWIMSPTGVGTSIVAELPCAS